MKICFQLNLEGNIHCTNLVVMVPPVATAVTKRKKQKSQNQGAKDVATPLINCKNTAATNGIRRPNLWNITNVYYKSL